MNFIIVNLIEHLHENERPNFFVLHSIFCSASSSHPKWKRDASFRRQFYFDNPFKFYSIHHKCWATNEFNEE